jgi:hypothetical protein
MHPPLPLPSVVCRVLSASQRGTRGVQQNTTEVHPNQMDLLTHPQGGGHRLFWGVVFRWPARFGKKQIKTERHRPEVLRERRPALFLCVLGLPLCCRRYRCNRNHTKKRRQLFAKNTRGNPLPCPGGLDKRSPCTPPLLSRFECVSTRGVQKHHQKASNTNGPFDPPPGGSTAFLGGWSLLSCQ